MNSEADLHPSPSRTLTERGGAAGYKWTLAALLLAGLLLRWWQLGRESLWFDEGYSAWVATLPLGEIVTTIRNDVSPPLYYLLLHAWRGLFGESEFALRSMSAVAASLSLMVFGLLTAQVLKSHGARLLAMALFAASVLQVQYAQEARSYGLATLLALASVWGMLRWLGACSKPALCVAIVAAATSVWLHNMMWFYLAGLNAAWLLAPGSVPLKRRLVSLLLLDGMVVLAYVPWLLPLLEQMAWLKGNFWASVPGWRDLLQILSAVSGCKVWHLSRVLHVAAPSLAPHLWLGAAAAGAAVLLAVSRQRGDRRRLALALIAYSLLPVFAVFVHAQSGQSYFIEKVFTASAAVLPLVLAMALEGPAMRLAWAPAGLILLLSGVSIWGYFAWEQKEDWRTATGFVNAQQPELVVFVANEGEYLYDYYTRQAGMELRPRTGTPQGFFDLHPPRTIQKVRHDADLRLLLSRLDTQKPSRVTLVLSHTDWSDPQALTLAALQSRYAKDEAHPFRLIEVHTFE